MRTLIIALSALIVAGCAAPNRQPRWEVSVNVALAEKINPDTAVTTSITIKRPVSIDKK